MNFFLMLVSIVVTAVIAKYSNEMLYYIAGVLVLIAIFIKIVLRDIELEARVKRLENAEKENKQ